MRIKNKNNQFTFFHGNTIIDCKDSFSLDIHKFFWSKNTKKFQKDYVFHLSNLYKKTK